MQESDKKHEKEFHEKEADKGNKRKKSLLEIHQSKVAKKKRVSCSFILVIIESRVNDFYTFVSIYPPIIS